MFYIHTSFPALHDFIKSVLSMFVASNIIIIIEPICFPWLFVTPERTHVSHWAWNRENIRASDPIPFLSAFHSSLACGNIPIWPSKHKPKNPKNLPSSFSMAGFMPRGSIIQFNWQETPEGREFLGGILHRNRRKTFGEPRFLDALTYRHTEDWKITREACVLFEVSMKKLLCHGFSSAFASASRTLQNKT